MTFVATFKFTPQGIADIQDTCKRAGAIKKAAKKMGVTVKEIFWTLGPFDGLCFFDAFPSVFACCIFLRGCINFVAGFFGLWRSFLYMVSSSCLNSTGH